MSAESVCLSNVELYKNAIETRTLSAIQRRGNIDSDSISDTILAEFFERAKKGLKKYVDKEKSLEWLSSASSYYQQEKVNQDFMDQEKVLTVIDSLRTNPADAERIGLNLDSLQI